MDYVIVNTETKSDLCNYHFYSIKKKIKLKSFLKFLRTK